MLKLWVPHPLHNGQLEEKNQTWPKCVLEHDYDYLSVFFETSRNVSHLREKGTHQVVAYTKHYHTYVVQPPQILCSLVLGVKF